MNRTVIHLESKDVPAYLRGSYTGKKFKAVITESFTIPASAGIWNGGSRDTYSFVELGSGRTVQSPYQQTAPWDQHSSEFSAQLPPEIALIEHTIFCGKDLGLTFYLHPDAVVKMLPPNNPELTETQKLVLNATASLKASYNGKDRYENSKPYGAMSKEEVAERLTKVKELFALKGNVKLQSGKMATARITELENWSNFFPSRNQWESAKEELIAQGYLNKAGAITVKGRNAR